MKKVDPSDIFSPRWRGGEKKILYTLTFCLWPSTCHVSQRSRLAKKSQACSGRSATRRRGLPQERGSATGRTRAVSACPTRTTGLARSRRRALPPGAQPGAARPRRVRSVRSATRRPGAAGQCGAAQRRTRAVSAYSTRATRSAQSRRRALPLAAQQVELDLTACGRCGPRRVGRAWRGGAELWCWAVARGGGPPPRARTSLPRLHMRLELRRHPWHWGTSLLGKTSDRRDAQRPWSAFLIATVAAASPTGARTARRRPGPERPSARRAVGIFAGGVIKRG